jgi:hypothetical protein
MFENDRDQNYVFVADFNPSTGVTMVESGAKYLDGTVINLRLECESTDSEKPEGERSVTLRWVVTLQVDCSVDQINFLQNI